MKYTEKFRNVIRTDEVDEIHATPPVQVLSNKEISKRRLKRVRTPTSLPMGKTLEDYDEQEKPTWTRCDRTVLDAGNQAIESGMAVVKVPEGRNQRFFMNAVKKILQKWGFSSQVSKVAESEICIKIKE